MSAPTASLPVVLSVAERIGSGAFADVFLRPRERVAKLFRRKPHDTDGLAVRAVCREEMAAYDIAQANDALRRHTAKYFGPLTVERVVDGQGTDVTDCYWVDCCYELERLSGASRSIRDVPEFLNECVDTLVNQFNAAGIEYTTDASMFGWESPLTLKVVDIARHEAQADYPKRLYGPDAP